MAILFHCLEIGMVWDLSVRLELTIHGNYALPQLWFGESMDASLRFIQNLGQDAPTSTNGEDWSPRA